MRLFQRRPLAATLPPIATLRVTPCQPVPCDDCPVCYEPGDEQLAVSELEGRLARTIQRLEREAARLEARYVRYAWTEQLAAELRNIAHDTMGS